MARGLNWTREETILAGWAGQTVGWRGVNSSSPVVRDLSELLQSLPIHPQDNRSADFRTPGSVNKKINSLCAARPDYRGVGLRVIQLEAEVSEQFWNDPQGMLVEVGRILERYGVERGRRLAT